MSIWNPLECKFMLDPHLQNIVHQSCGDYNRRRNNLTVAENYFDKALKIDETNKKTLTSQSKVHSQNGRDDLTLKMAGLALDEDRVSAADGVYMKALYNLTEFEKSLGYSADTSHKLEPLTIRKKNYDDHGDVCKRTIHTTIGDETGACLNDKRKTISVIQEKDARKGKTSKFK